MNIRGWHAIQGNMYSAEELAADQLTYLTTGNFINVSGVAQANSIVFPREQFKPLLGSGLYDVNGKEMYQGDIVRSKKNMLVDQGYVVGEVIFASGMFKIRNVPLSTLLHDFAPEVIGNKYENPEIVYESDI